MAENDDQWLWFDDDENEQSPLQVVTGSTDGKTAATSTEVVKAVELHLAGKTDEALRELKRAIDIGKSLPEIYPVYGQICFELKKYDDAAAMFGNLIVLERRHKTGFYNQGVCLEKCGRFKEAAEAFRTAIDIDPDRKEARLGLGICLLRLGECGSSAGGTERLSPLRSEQRDSAIRPRHCPTDAGSRERIDWMPTGSWWRRHRTPRQSFQT